MTWCHRRVPARIWMRAITVGAMHVSQCVAVYLYACVYCASAHNRDTCTCEELLRVCMLVVVGGILVCCLIKPPNMTAYYSVYEVCTYTHLRISSGHAHAVSCTCCPQDDCFLDYQQKWNRLFHKLFLRCHHCNHFLAQDVTHGIQTDEFTLNAVACAEAYK